MPKGVSHYTTGTLSEHRVRNILSGVSVEVEGDWVKAKVLLTELPALTKASAVKAQLDFATKLRKQIWENIETNGSSIGWAPLKNNYKRWKDKQDAAYGSSFMYRFFGTYYNSIEIMQDGHNVSVGVSKDRDRINPLSKLRVSQYALILEMGAYSRGIPPRPLWGPSFAQIGGRRELLRLMKNRLGLAVKVYGITLQ